MKNYLLTLTLLAACALTTGCVSKKQLAAAKADYDKLNTEYATLQGNYQNAQVTIAKAEANQKNLEDRLKEAQRNQAQLQKAYATLQSSLNKSLEQNTQGNVNISKLVDEINASNRFIKQLVETKSKSDSLNMVLTNRLTRSLSREELQEVDVQVLKGVVYISLADNMLYKSGSYTQQDCKNHHGLQGLRCARRRQHRQRAHLKNQHPQQLGLERTPRLFCGASSAKPVWRRPQASLSSRSRRIQPHCL